MALSEFVESYGSAKVAAEEVGHVVFVADSIVHAEGLPGAVASEPLILEGGTAGLIMNPEECQIDVVVLRPFDGVDEGQVVRRINEVLSMLVSDARLGRVVDPLGRPTDGPGEIEAEGHRALKLQTSGVMTRELAHEPFQTGLKAVDSAIPIGCGQRQFIIGSRQTGKTATAPDTTLNQKGTWESDDPNKQVCCIYMVTGQRGSIIAAMCVILGERSALEYTAAVVSSASGPASFKCLSPCTGSAIGQYWMYQSKHVLIIFGDLSRQAETYRVVSLLLRRPPDHKAYPDDVFYLHSRPLKRCSKPFDKLGTGSMTGLPIIKAKANDVSTYIPANVISITDGQIFLQPDLFDANQHPAVDVDISVSRMGGAAQVRAMKRVTETLEIILVQYHPMQAFAIFASDLNAATCAQLTRGERLMELLKQSQCTPYPVAKQVASVWAGTKNYLDDINVSDVLPFKTVFLDRLRYNTDILDTVESTGQFTGETEGVLIKAVEALRRTLASGEQMLGAQVAEPEEEPVAEKTTEQLVVKRG